MDDLRYPIGQFKMDNENSGAMRNKWINEIANAPRELRKALHGLTPEHIDTPYRPNGWTVRQVVHHLADSHLNGYIRFKLALTEEEPSIKPFFEDRWATLEDYCVTDIETSVLLLEVLHKRWVTIIQSLAPENFDRTYTNPEAGSLTLNTALSLYAWHGKHHIAHITSLRKRKGW